MVFISTKVQTVLICMFLTLALPATVFAGDAEDAVELLAVSLKCPIKLYKSEMWHIGDSLDPTFITENNQWSGSTSQLRIDNTWDLGMGDERSSDIANFSNLESVDTGIDQDTIPPTSMFTIYCANKAKCISQETYGANGESYGTERERYHVCDQQTASNAKLAIDTLITLAKSRR
jgi:hypothetical protein